MSSEIVDNAFAENSLTKLKIWVPSAASWGYYDITIIRSVNVAASGTKMAMPDNILLSVVFSDI